MSVPKPGETVTPEFAKEFVTHFTRSDRNLSYAVERDSTPFIVQALMNQGHVLTIRSCDMVCLLKDNETTETISNSNPPELENYIVKELEPEDAQIVSSHWSFGLWEQPVHYVRMCIERFPSAGIYSKETNELMSWVICYNFGSFGMLHTPEKFRGKGFATIVMKRLLEEHKARGLIPVTGVERRNHVSRRLMTKLGFEYTHDMDFIYTS